MNPDESGTDAQETVKKQEIANPPVATGSNDHDGNTKDVKANAAEAAETAEANGAKAKTANNSQHDQKKLTENEETVMAAEKKTESSAIELSHGSAVLGNRPVGDTGITISGTMTFSGVRPIEASTLVVYDTMLGGRPIEASDLAVVDTDTMPGHRPIFASTLAVVDADTLPGHRPIAASPAYLMQGSELPNNRPIASNAPDAGATLMGFLD